MIDLKKEIEKLESQLVYLNKYMSTVPAPLKDRETAKVIEGLIKAATEKLEILRKEEKRLW